MANSWTTGWTRGKKNLIISAHIIWYCFLFRSCPSWEWFGSFYAVVFGDLLVSQNQITLFQNTIQFNFGIDSPWKLLGTRRRIHNRLILLNQTNILILTSLRRRVTRRSPMKNFLFTCILYNSFSTYTIIAINSLSEENWGFLIFPVKETKVGELIINECDEGVHERF